MTNKETSEPRYLEHSLRRGAAIYWMDQYLVVEGWDLKDLTISVRNHFTGEQSKISYTSLIILPSSAKKPIFANSIDELLAKIKNGEHEKENVAIVSEDGIHPTHLKKGRHVIKMIETVRQAKKAAHDKAGNRRINEVTIIEDCLKRLPRPNSLTTYYDYEHRYDINDGDLARIARSFQTRRYGKTRQSPVLIHLFELLLERFHFDPNGFVLEISTIINKLRKILKRSNNLWIDSSKCGGVIPEDLIEELLDTDTPLPDFSQTPEKLALLVPVSAPKSDTWFYGRYAYVREIKEQKDDFERTAHQRYGQRTQFPLGLGYLDEMEITIKQVVKGEEIKLLDLWAAIAIDSYARAIPGFQIHTRVPDLDVVLSTFRYCIFPKDLKELMGFDIQLPYGIFIAKSLDNAMAHDVDALIRISDAVSCKGEYTRMDISFRPPGSPQKGTIVERMVGTFKHRLREDMGKIAIDISEFLTSNTDKQAAQIVEYMERRFIKIIDEYHHTRHSTLHQCPIDRWNEGINNLMGEMPLVPPLTPELERAFWPPYYDTRIVKDGRISLGGLHFMPLEEPGLPTPDLRTYDFAGRKIHYSIRGSSRNIGRITIYQNGDWLGDMVALELLGPDGRSLKQVSKLERKFASVLAKQAGESPREWIDFLGKKDAIPTSQTDINTPKPQAGKPNKTTSKDSAVSIQPPSNYWDNLSSALSDFARSTNK